MAIEAFQICCLLLPPENRRKLQLLMRMMARICLNKEMPPLCDGFGTRTLVGWFLTSTRTGVLGLKFTWVKFTSLATRGRYKAGSLKEPWLGIHPDWYCAFGLSDLKNIMKSKEWVEVDTACRDSCCILPAVNTKRRKHGQKGLLACQETAFSPPGQKGSQSLCYYNQ